MSADIAAPKTPCFASVRVFQNVLRVVHDVLQCITMIYKCFMMFYYIQQCVTMFSESLNDRNRRIGERAAADRLRDRDNVAGIGDNSGKIGDDAAGIVDIAAKVIPF